MNKKNIHRLDANLVMEASAGTGKTRSLLDRAEFIIQNDPELRIKELVAVTFTEKAAAELKNKLRDRVAGLSGVSPSRKQQLVSDFEQAEISTIHGFCAKLLRLRPVESGLSPAFKVLDESESAAIFDLAWNKWLELGQENDTRFLALAKKMELGVEEIKGLAKELYDNRDLFYDYKQVLFRAEGALGFEDAEKEFQKLHKLLKQEAPKAKALNNVFDELADMLKHDEFKERAWLQYANDTLDRKEPWKQKGFLKANEILPEINRLFERVRIRPLIDLIKELESFIDLLGREKEQRELADFQDLLLFAEELVRKNKGAREYFKQRYKYILVDEFQDTDPLQAKLLFFLSERKGESATDWKQVKLAAGKLFLVGDPKQSIYRFRRADLAIYEQAKQALLRDASGDSGALKKNYRSHPKLLEWVNLTFEKRFAPDEQTERDGFQPRYQGLEPGQEFPEAEAGKKPVLLIELERPVGKNFRAEDKVNVDEARGLEAEAVVNFINSAVNRYEILEKDGDAFSTRKARYSDFAILYPTHTGAKFTEEALRKSGIPFQTEASKEFMLREETAGLKNIFCALSNPYDSLALVGALRSLFFGVNDRELFEYKKQGNNWEWLAGSPDQSKYPAIADAFAFMNQLYRERDRKPVTWMVERLIERSQARRLKNFHPRFNQALANLERIKSAAAGFDQDPALLFFDFVEWLKGLEDSGGFNWPEVTASAAGKQEGGPGLDAVKLMTIHKSKGLEFPVVIIIDLCHNLGEKTGDLLKDWNSGALAISLGNFKTGNFEEMSATEAEHQKQERVRNYYVAVTRAKQYLVLCDFRGIYTPRSASALDLISDGLPTAGDGEGPRLEMVQKLKASDFEKAGPPGKDDAVARLLDRLTDQETKIEKELVEFEKEHKQQVARASEHLEIFAPSTEDKYEGAGQGGSIKRDEARAIGTVVHKVIELAGSRGLDSALRLAERLAKEKGIAGQLPKIRELVDKFWSSGFKKQLTGDLYSELPFLIEHDGKVFRGKIDLVQRLGQKLRVVDFKTDDVPESGIDEHATKNYQKQMEIYREAVKRLKGGPETESSVYFIKPGIEKKL